MSSEAINTKDKEVVRIANMLHTVAPRLYISTIELNVEDTFVHTVFKLIFGIKNSENGHVSCIRHDITIAEVKPTCASSERLPSDLVKLGQQMKVMLDNVVNYRVGSPKVCGILVEGKNCSLYKMDIVRPNPVRIAVDTAKKVERTELIRAKGKRLFKEAIPVSWVYNSICTFSVVKESDN
ncbi:hypothetical protein MFLAVUS_003638 [Mucor flavus]|uniref:Uncharacterized protein n=1 Tax=Mucor flavus TaxID=439312 RepID=A0ABP9YTM7_9FUNG